jgi:serine protease AprX
MTTGRHPAARAIGTALALLLAVGTATAHAEGPRLRYLLRPVPGHAAAALRAAHDAGAREIRRLGIGGIAALELTGPRAARLAGSRWVASLVPDTRVSLASVDGHAMGGDLGALTSVARAIGADRYWRAGYTGRGVDVALIDSGVLPVKGLAAQGKVVNGADLSFESQDADLRYLDTFGHGTHLAGIIAGRDGRAGKVDPNDRSRFLGIAPGSRIVNVKVADAFGTTDVSQVLAAIGWVVEHRRDHGLDIRVLNLAFGTDGVQSYVLDPLAFAVEQAWRKGIFVVVSAGNKGYGSRKLDDPAYDPIIMAVGATDRRGTATRTDDRVAGFSSVGDASRHPDVVVPGTSIVSLRAPGSNIDRSYPGARVGDTPRLFRGSGTSQAAAVVSGAAALVIEQRPGIKPDQLKKLLKGTAYDLPKGTAGQGSGLLDLKAAFGARTPAKGQGAAPSLGTGTLDAARGTLHLVRDTTQLRGERTIFEDGRLDLLAWVRRTLLGTVWVGGAWMDELWTAACWCADTWAGDAWKGRSWTTLDWTGRSWTSDAWRGRSWTGRSWTGDDWQGRSWTSDTWSGDTWSTVAWGS